MTYFLGIDTSTTSSKALLIDEKGEVIAVTSNPHTLQTPKPLWSEQDPREWWDAVAASIKSVLEKAGISGERVGAVGLTGQMHGLVLLDDSDNVLRPAILWNDQRTQSQCDEIHRIIGKEKFIRITGNVALTGFTAPKILWVKENEPDVYAKAKHVLLPKDYVRLKLTGAYAMDKADGAGTVLFDLKARDWSDEVLSALDIPRAWMPKTFEGTEFTGYITEEAAALTGLKVGTPVAAGGGDQAAGAVGVGAVEPGIVGLTVGTRSNPKDGYMRFVMRCRACGTSWA
jgi:xylulokinase